ncbi:protein YOP1 [Kluyveromyces marxianus DMKU3-1042]|uniref:Protein YOP1 n=1 Tax=Kluyveromyces marxianus (strain DMKU3-1042 / BCC 29191 / NBRC 104275) TaxID=1003335 RepID=W0TGQ1_KLUMD|nr:protein YOP1 [Kluyveromyces marxianus DMKU3-1042]BAO41986.2 protein YOP1 [Kluyveromyces marxianus DMKU3-1042]
MVDYLKFFKSSLKDVEKNFGNNEVMNTIEKKTKLPKSYIIYGSAALYFLLILINVGGIGEILANFVGFCIPTYYSLKALKTNTTKDDTQLLTYWIVFSFLSVIEFWSKAILAWVPFYWFFKTLFLLYIAIPSLGGAQFVFKRVIEPLSDKYMPLVEGKPENLAKKVEEAANNAANNAKASGFTR